MSHLLFPVVGGPHNRIARPGELVPLGQRLSFRDRPVWLEIPDQQDLVLTVINRDFSVFLRNGQPATFAAVGLPTLLSMDVAGVVTGTTDAIAGDFDVTVTATNAAGESATSFEWRVVT